MLIIIVDVEISGLWELESWKLIPRNLYVRTWHNMLGYHPNLQVLVNGFKTNNVMLTTHSFHYHLMWDLTS